MCIFFGLCAIKKMTPTLVYLVIHLLTSKIWEVYFWWCIIRNTIYVFRFQNHLIIINIVAQVKGKKEGKPNTLNTKCILYRLSKSSEIIFRKKLSSLIPTLISKCCYTFSSKTFWNQLNSCADIWQKKKQLNKNKISDEEMIIYLVFQN